MKNLTIRSLSFFSLFLGLIFLGGCFTSSMAPVTIGINLPAELRSSATSRAGVGNVPGGVSSFRLTVTGSGMATITESVAVDATSVTVNVPTGSGRTFLMEALDSGSIVVYRGSTTVDISGAELTISISMEEVLPSFKSITSFNFVSPAVTGSINESAKTITLTVPYGTSTTNLIPTIVHTGASISPASGVGQNFASPVNYTVTAQDSSQQIYSVTVVQDTPPIKYVATSGNDTTGDGSSGNPYATIQKAITEIGAGEVRVAAGTYTITATITLNSFIRLVGGYESTGWTRNISANVTTISWTGSSVNPTLITLSGLPGNELIEGFTLNAQDTNGSAVGLSITNSPNVIIRRNIFTIKGSNSSAYGALISGTFNGTIEQNHMTFLTSPRYLYGLYFSSIGASSPIIRNNLIHVGLAPGNGGAIGIYLGTGGTTPAFAIRNNTFIIGRSNTGYPAYAFGEGGTSNNGTVTINFDNNIIYSNQTLGSTFIFGIHRGNSTYTVQSMKNNNWFNLDAVWAQGNTNIIYQYPADINGVVTGALGNTNYTLTGGGFVNDTSDWHLSGAASAEVRIGGLDGSSLGWGYTTDLEETPRTGSAGTGWSMGAYEY